MASKRKLPRFSRRYDSFLSEASNEEIVSISKELTDEISVQVKSMQSTAVAVLGITMVSMILAISLVTDLSSSVSSSVKNMIFLMRMIAIGFMCIAMLVTYMVIQRATAASSFSALMWRHVRETASDENTYEQMDAVRGLNVALASGKNLNVTATLMLVLAALFLGMSYIYQMMAASGYI